MGFERNAGDDIDDILMCLESELATADRVVQDYTNIDEQMGSTVLHFSSTEVICNV